MGTWKIKAHYKHDEANAASVEFKVQKFSKPVWFTVLLFVLQIIQQYFYLHLYFFSPPLVLPSFEVNIIPKESYILLGTEQFEFTITAL